MGIQGIEANDQNQLQTGSFVFLLQLFSFITDLPLGIPH